MFFLKKKISTPKLTFKKIREGEGEREGEREEEREEEKEEERKEGRGRGDE